MAKLTREEKDELAVWSLEVAPMHSGSNKIVWCVELCRGAKLMASWWIFGTIEEALKFALNIDLRREFSPTSKRPIPPSQVNVTLSGKFLAKDDHSRRMLVEKVFSL